MRRQHRHSSASVCRVTYSQLRTVRAGSTAGPWPGKPDPPHRAATAPTVTRIRARGRESGDTPWPRPGQATVYRCRPAGHRRCRAGSRTADLRGADLTGADHTAVVLRGSVLPNARLVDTPPDVALLTTLPAVPYILWRWCRELLNLCLRELSASGVARMAEQIGYTEVEDRRIGPWVGDQQV